MKRLVPLLLLTLASCHRLTELEGRAGEARHGNGFHVLSLISTWLALFAIVVGGGFVSHGLIVRRGDSDRILWGSVLAVIGRPAHWYVPIGPWVVALPRHVLSGSNVCGTC